MAACRLQLLIFLFRRDQSIGSPSVIWIQIICSSNDKYALNEATDSKSCMSIANQMSQIRHFPQNSSFHQTWNLSKKFRRPNFWAKEFYTLKTRKSRLFLPAINSENASLSVIWPFWLKSNKMCKFFNSYEESLHLGLCKRAKYVRNCVVFWKNLHS